MTDTAPQPSRPSLRCRWQGHAATLGMVVFSPIAILSALLHVTLQDQWSWLAPVYYALPLSLITLFCGWAGFVCARRRRFKVALCYALFGVACGTGFYTTTWCPTVAQARDVKPDFELLTWNGWNGNLGVERLAKGIAEHAPDIAAIVESGTLSDQVDVWGAALPGYTVVPFHKEVVVLTKGRVSNPRQFRLGAGSSLATCRVHLRDGIVQLAVVDLVSNPLRSRRPAFQRLREELDKLPKDAPLLLVGDFNTPRRSCCFELLPPMLQNAWEVSGGGFGNTWPSLFPLWDLDQIWIDPDHLILHATESHWTSRSDHLPLLAGFSFKD